VKEEKKKRKGIAREKCIGVFIVFFIIFYFYFFSIFQFLLLFILYRLSVIVTINDDLCFK